MKARIVRLLHCLAERRYATGGVLPARPSEGDGIPAVLSRGCSTTLRPGESAEDATERLLYLDSRP